MYSAASGISLDSSEIYRIISPVAKARSFGWARHGEREKVSGQRQRSSPLATTFYGYLVILFDQQGTGVTGFLTS